MIPLYKDKDEPFPSLKPENAHSGLWFERFFNGFDRNWEIPKPDKETGKDVKRDWINQVTNDVGNKRQLDAFQERQQTLIKAWQGDCHCYKTDWHFVTGMGNPHPVENGFSWHPTLAVPYLAGSAVKGLVRAWVELKKAEIIAELEKIESVNGDLLNQEKKADLKEKETTINKQLKHWFGTDDKEQVAEQSGAFIFFDALPSEPPELLCDIMTPHMGKWYEQGDTGSLDSDKIPADWHEPVPVPFLAVKKAQFIFRIAARNPQNKADVDELDEIFEALNNALLWLGAGAKTAVGYGYMSKD